MGEGGSSELKGGNTVDGAKVDGKEGGGGGE